MHELRIKDTYKCNNIRKFYIYTTIEGHIGRICNLNRIEYIIKNLNNAMKSIKYMFVSDHVQNSSIRAILSSICAIFIFNFEDIWQVNSIITRLTRKNEFNMPVNDLNNFKRRNTLIAPHLLPLYVLK